MSTTEPKLTMQEQAALRYKEAMWRAKEVRCPRCRAPIGEECFARNGDPRKPHAGRAHALIRSGRVV